MLKYETVQVWDAIQISIKEWIESVILIGWNVFRGQDKRKELSDELTNTLVKYMIKEEWISENEILYLKDRFYPQIEKWINEILLIRWDFLRKEGILERYAISLTKELVRVFLEEEDFVEFV